MPEKYRLLLLGIGFLIGAVFIFADKKKREKYKYQWTGKRNMTILIIIGLLMCLMFYIIYTSKKQKRIVKQKSEYIFNAHGPTRI